jgi:hypothetical protein
MKLNHAQLGLFSQRLASAVFSVRPDLRDSASMIRSGEVDGLSLEVLIPSPTTDAGRLLKVWVDERATPSVGFGPNHTHGTPDYAGIAAVVDIMVGVLTDQVVIIEDVGGEYARSGRWLDLRIADAVEEALTERYSPGHALLKSWSGEGDREVGL